MYSIDYQCNYNICLHMGMFRAKLNTQTGAM
jgi:hypothetical protein